MSKNTRPLGSAYAHLLRIKHAEKLAIMYVIINRARTKFWGMETISSILGVISSMLQLFDFETGTLVSLGMMPWPLEPVWRNRRRKSCNLLENKASISHPAASEHWMTFNSCFRALDICWSFWEAKCHSEVYGTRYCTDLSLLFCDLSVETVREWEGITRTISAERVMGGGFGLFLILVVYLNRTFQPFRSKHLFVPQRWWERT
jgi:hypothetical protein